MGNTISVIRKTCCRFTLKFFEIWVNYFNINKIPYFAIGNNTDCGEFSINFFVEKLETKNKIS